MKQSNKHPLYNRWRHIRQVTTNPNNLEYAALSKFKEPLFEEFEIDPTRVSNVWLQPLSQSEKATDICIELANEYGWRVSIQTHKFLGLR